MKKKFLLHTVEKFINSAHLSQCATIQQMHQRHGDALINKCNSQGQTALCLAAGWSETTDCLDYLLGAGAALELADKDGTTPLIYAAINKRLPQLKKLLTHGANVHATQIREPWTALHYASREGMTEGVLLLLDKGAVINPSTDKIWTPLMLAAANNHWPCVETLLAAGASPCARHHDSSTASDIAARFGHTEMAARLKEEEVKWIGSGFHQAIPLPGLASGLPLNLRPPTPKGRKRG